MRGPAAKCNIENNRNKCNDKADSADKAPDLTVRRSRHSGRRAAALGLCRNQVPVEGPGKLRRDAPDCTPGKMGVRGGGRRTAAGTASPRTRSLPRSRSALSSRWSGARAWAR